MTEDGSGELVAEAIEVHLSKGDALLFVDCMLHGSARRTNPGERRIFIARCENALSNIDSGFAALFLVRKPSDLTVCVLGYGFQIWYYYGATPPCIRWPG